MDLIASFKGLDPIIQALIATLFTWGLTALGASAVMFFKRPSRKLLDAMLGFAGGVMIAASFWSLLMPAIDMASGGPLPAIVPAAVGFGSGGLFLWGIDKVLPHVHPNLKGASPEGMKTHWHRSTLLVLAITLHNIPEGLAVGVAFGALTSDLGGASFGGAVALAVGIGIQNFPEGFSVSVPLRREGITRGKAFWYGQLSGMVEPVAGVIGAGLVMLMEPLLPYALSFAAGAMIFVVAEEVLPESQREGNTDLSTMAVMAGFMVMMILDVVLA